MEETLKKAIAKYGTDSQINIAIQEMAELIKELTDISRNRTNKNKLATEIADVQITLEQIILILSSKYPNFKEEIEKEKEKKILRLKKAIENNN